MTGIIFLIVAFSYLFIIDFFLISYKVFHRTLRIEKLNRWTWNWVNNILKLISRTFKIKFILEIPEEEILPERFLILSNHQSLIDIIALMVAFPNRELRFVAKKELGRGIPAASKVLRWQGHALIDRKKNLTETARELKDFVKRTEKQGSSIVVFPEGTRSKSGNLLPFNNGAHKIIQSGSSLPVLVFAVEGGYKLSHVLHFVSSQISEYRVKYVGTFDAPKGKSDIQQNLIDAQTMIQKQLDTWRKETDS